jgi:hypothetical protein
MLVDPLCCNDDRAGEIGPTFHFMIRIRHDLVLTNDTVGGTMEELVKGRAAVNGSTYQWNTITCPVRGKGPHSPETEYGADAVIEIVLRNELGETVASKILPIQSKTRTRRFIATKLSRSRRID